MTAFKIGSHPIAPVGTALILLFAGIVAARTVALPLRWALLAVPGAYVARKIGLRTGEIKWVDHHVLERVSEHFDNIESWLIALAVACVALVVARRLERHP